MAVTVIDSSNLADILADAGVEPDPTPTVTAKPDDEVKTESTAESKVEETAQDDADDEEGEDGLTPREKRDLSAKMLKAVGKRVRQRKAAEEFADAQYREKQAAESRAADLERQLNEIKGKNQPEQKPSGEPKRENFASENEYIDARIEWKADQKFAQREQERLASEAGTRMFRQVERAKELVPDFAEVTSKASIEVPQYVVEYMRESDLFAELGYHFAKHPEVVKRLSAMAPVKQLVELGKIEGILKPFASAKDDTSTVSRKEPSTLDTGFSPSKARSDAPVIRPLTSGEGSQVEADPSEMNTREMINAWQRTNKVQLNRRKRH